MWRPPCTTTWASTARRCPSPTSRAARCTSSSTVGRSPTLVRGNLLLALEARRDRGAVGQLKPIAVAERLGELLLVRHQQDAAQLPAQVLQLLDHHLSAVAVQTPKALIDDDRLNRPMLAAGVL